MRARSAMRWSMRSVGASLGCALLGCGLLACGSLAGDAGAGRPDASADATLDVTPAIVPDATPATASDATPATAPDATPTIVDATPATAPDATPTIVPDATPPSPPAAARAPSMSLTIIPRVGATAEPVLRPVILELRDALAGCRPRGAAGPAQVVVEVTVEPFGGRARAWMSAPDKRNLTVEQWAAAEPIGRCLSRVLGEPRWPRPGDGQPAAFAVELRWRE